FADAAQLAAPDAELRQRVVDLEVPLVAAAPRLDRDDAGGEAPVLRQVRRLEDADGFNAINRHGGAELAGRRIGDIRRVDDERAAVLALAGNFDLAFPERTTPGTSGSVSLTVAGLPGSSLTVARGSSLGAEAIFST